MFVSKITQQFKKSRFKVFKGVALAKKTTKKAPRKKIKAPPKRETPEKIVITDELRGIWLKVRRSWNMSHTAFSNTVSLLSDKKAEQLYGLVRHSLFKGSYVEILREHPELREILRSDDDRICMHDIYEVLSWRLRKSEKMPKDIETTMRVKGRIGRDAIKPSYW